jgi:hypothetical protein
LVGSSSVPLNDPRSEPSSPKSDSRAALRVRSGSALMKSQAEGVSGGDAGG